ncbi:ferredoxin [Rhodovarius crocodyli]|uniref:Ferredoxin n=1 Tax=Rhodovarius crocodyli TaxID=1979269 RepID=A0A437ME97_9PROT|nr:ferredoxin [Rhodovarius crocodyli]RVT95919.1 ferredoxin [Rhodovarius crocodyli]
MFVILTSKPGQFHTEPGPGLTPVEAWDYVFCGNIRAHFVIAELSAASRVRIVDESGPVNSVPTKFLESFDTIEDARKELRTLTTYGNMPVELKAVAA